MGSGFNNGEREHARSIVLIFGVARRCGLQSEQSESSVRERSVARVYDERMRENESNEPNESFPVISPPHQSLRRHMAWICAAPGGFVLRS